MVTNSAAVASKNLKLIFHENVVITFPPAVFLEKFWSSVHTHSTLNRTSFLHFPATILVKHLFRFADVLKLRSTKS